MVLMVVEHKEGSTIKNSITGDNGVIDHVEIIKGGKGKIL